MKTFEFQVSIVIWFIVQPTCDLLQILWRIL